MTARARRSAAPRLAPAQPLSLLDPPTAPAPAVAPAPAAPATPPRRRDFDAVRELVWHRDGQRFVLRERQSPRDGGAHVYHAYELADASFFGITREGISPAAPRPYGRMDTRLSPRAFDTVTEYSAAVEWRLEQQRRALELIRELCPETRRDPQAGSAPGHAVFDGPGCVTMLSHPAVRYAAFLAARRPE